MNRNYEVGMADLLKRLRRLCANCVMAPQNRKLVEDDLRPCCEACLIKWEAANEIELLLRTNDRMLLENGRLLERENKIKRLLAEPTCNA